jgi:hypothetical protein
LGVGAATLLNLMEDATTAETVWVVNKVILRNEMHNKNYTIKSFKEKLNNIKTLCW